jgi:hypothetical protein
MSSNEKKMKKQCIVFSVDKKNASISQSLCSRRNLDGYSSNSWFVCLLNMIVNKLFEIEKSYSGCGLPSSK